MAKRDDNFGFDTDSKPKAQKEINLEFLNNIKFLDKLTYKQKEIAFFSAIIAVIIIMAIAVTLIVIGVNGGFDGGNTSNNNNGGNSGGDSFNGQPDIPEQEEISNIEISSEPDDLSYYVNDPADFKGLTIVIKDKNGVEMFINYVDHIEEFTIEGFDSSEAVAEQEITVKFRGEKVGSFMIEILPIPDETAKLVSLTVFSAPRDTYVRNEYFDPTGGVLRAEYSDGSVVDVNLDYKHIYDFQSICNIVGTHTIRFVYRDNNGMSAETTFEVTITE